MKDDTTMDPKAEFPAVYIHGGEMKTYTFEGKEFVIHHDPYGNSLASLADLCEIHQCGTPEDVLPLLRQSGCGYHDPCDLADSDDDPGASLVNLDNHDLMGTIRALSTDWDLAVRFRHWLVAKVFHTSPHLDSDQERWDDILPSSRFKSADECRDYYWAKELKRHQATLAPTPVNADVLETVNADLFNRLGYLLREVQERGQCSPREAAAVLVATIHVVVRDLGKVAPPQVTQH